MEGHGGRNKMYRAAKHELASEQVVLSGEEMKVESLKPHSFIQQHLQNMLA